MDEQTYEIREGVRRSKAAWLCGHETIPASIGGIGEVFEVPVRSLLAPKPIIEDIGPRGGDWGRAYRGTQRGDILPPIVVMPGSLGTPIADVEIQYDELELLRQRLTGNP